MSRSYRKNPYVTDQQGNRRTKSVKRAAARAVRAAKEVPSGKAYRRFFNPWDIRDWSFYDPKRAKRK